MQEGKEEYTFRRGDVCHIMNPDINQEIYGMPEYIGGLLSASPAHSADTFRKLYYDNGSHAGCIIYISSAQANDKSVEVVKKNAVRVQREGSFQEYPAACTGGGKDGVQILPFQQITAKDEFMNVKASSRDDILAAHRVPPQLMGPCQERRDRLATWRKPHGSMRLTSLCQ